MCDLEWFPQIQSHFAYRTGHTEELQWKTSISLFVDSWWLLYTQLVMSEGNTANTEIRPALDAVKIVKWAADKDTMLKAHCTGQYFAQNYLRSYPPS